VVASRTGGILVDCSLLVGQILRGGYRTPKHAYTAFIHTMWVGSRVYCETPTAKGNRLERRLFWHQTKAHYVENRMEKLLGSGIKFPPANAFFTGQ
jgi:hypothetical protein